MMLFLGTMYPTVAISLIVFLVWQTLILPAGILRFHEDLLIRDCQWISTDPKKIGNLIHRFPAKVFAGPKDRIANLSGPEIITK